MQGVVAKHGDCMGMHNGHGWYQWPLVPWYQQVRKKGPGNSPMGRTEPGSQDICIVCYKQFVRRFAKDFRL